METYTLGGQKFISSINQALTANQDDYLLAHLRLAGALEVLDDLDGKKRTKEKRAEDLLTQILLSGRQFYILAGCLAEEGKTWNRTDADANAARFAMITEQADKVLMRQFIVGFVINFFSLGEPSSKNSRKSSSQSEKDPGTKSAAPQTSEISRP